jgi:hypothetical protein
MTDAVFAAFLGRQREAAMALAAASDLLDLVPIDDPLPQRYLARFRCMGLAETESGEIVPAARFAVRIWFPDSYLREADPFVVLAYLEPRRIFHPNVSRDAPFICIGRLAAATPLVEILYRVFEVLTWQRVTIREDEALNPDACAWARRNPQRFPVDRRGLKRGSADLVVETVR